MKISKINLNIEKIVTLLVILMPVSIAIGRGVADTNLSLVSFAFLAYLIQKKDFAFIKESWFKAAMLLWGYFVVNSVFRESNTTALLKSLPFLRFILFVLCFQYVVRRDVSISKRLLTVLSVVVCFLVIDGYIQFYFGKDLFGRVKMFDDMGTYQYYRLTGPFSKRVLGAVLMILSPVLFSVMLYKIKENARKYCVLLLPIVLIEVIIFLTGERAALIQSCISLVILFFCIYRNNINIVYLSIFVIFALFIAYLFVPQYLILRHLDSINLLKMGTQSEYGMLWKASIIMGLEHPLFGVGAGHFGASCKGLVDICNYHSHNVYLEMFAEFGIIGLLLFLLFLVVLFKDIIVVLKKKNSERGIHYILFLGVSVSIFVKLLPFLPSSSFFKNWYAVPLWFMIGWLFYLRQQISSQKH